MIEQILAGSLVIVLTVLFHAGLFRLASRWIDARYETARTHYGHGGMTALIIAGILTVLLGISIDIWLWSFVLLFADALPSLEESVYFSLVSFTTLGFGDIVLGKEWRIMGAMIAANGLLIFGWSIAFMTELVRKLHGGP